MPTERSAGLQRAVTEELRGDPRVDAARIDVSADDRTIALKGIVRSYSEKVWAERIAREIRGVVDVRNALEIRLPIGRYRTDSGLEHLTAEILENHTALCDPLPRVTARNGWLTLEGTVASKAEKRSCEDALQDVAGIRGITNDVQVTPGPGGAGIAEAFETAVRRRAALVVRKLRVEVSGATLSISGSVDSCVERDALLELASRRRGIATVIDHIVVQPSPNGGTQ